MNRLGGISKTEESMDHSDESFVVVGISASPKEMILSQMRNISSVNSPSASRAASFPTTVLNNLSPEEIQNKIQTIVNENVELKDALRQNNLAMKQQFDTLVKWQEEVFKVHQNHKQKFQETKELIQKLRGENSELKRKLAEMERTLSSTEVDSASKLQAENIILKNKIADADAREKVVRLLEFQLKTENANMKGKIIDLEKELALRGKSKNEVIAVEEEDLGGNFDEKFPVSFEIVSCSKMSHLEEAQKEGDAEETLLQVKERSIGGSLQLESMKQLGGDKNKEMKGSKVNGKYKIISSPMVAFDSRLGQLHNYLAAQEQKYIQTDVWLQKMNQIVLSVIPFDPVKGKEMKEDIVEFRKHLFVESEEIDQHRKHLLEAENLWSELKLNFETLQAQANSVKILEKGNDKTDLTHGYQQNLDEVLARLTKAEECLSISRAECLSLTNKLHKVEHELEEIPILKTQVEVYQADFNTEREERSRMAADKQQLSEEVHRLRAHNQQLQEDLENLERRFSLSPESSTSGVNSLPAAGVGILSAAQTMVNLDERSTKGSSEPRHFTCPKCYRAFMDLAPLEFHVDQCLDTP